MKTATKQVLVGALAFAFAFRMAQAGGWQNLGAGAKDAVVGFHTAVDPRDTNPQNGGAFVNLDGTIAYDAFFKYTGTITGDVRPAPGRAFTWHFLLDPDKTRYPSCSLEWGTNRILRIGLNPARPGWEYSEKDSGGRILRRASGAFCAQTPVQRSFGWPDDVGAALERLRDRHPRLDLQCETYSISLECHGDRVYVRQNGDYSGAFDVTPEFYRVTPVLRLSPWVRFRGITTRPLPADTEFETVSLDSILNAKGIGGASPDWSDSKAAPAPGSRIAVGGVVFQLPVLSRDDAFDNVDVGDSYVFQARLTGWSDWLERRWPQSSLHYPGRLSFAVPFRQYESLYLLAATEDERPGSIDTLTAQFHIPMGGAGFPKSFKSSPVLSFKAKAAGPACEVRLPDGESRWLHLVEIPIDFAALQEFRDQPLLQVELTKEVHPFRAWPDPVYGSVHGGGSPSRVHVFAATLKALSVPVSFEPARLANIFTEGEPVSYRATFRNADPAKAIKLDVAFTAVSWDKGETNRFERSVAIPPGGSATENFSFRPRKFGHHDIALAFTRGGRSDRRYVYPRTCAYIRKREYDPGRDLFTKGHLFGFWPWLGGHRTPTGPRQMEIAGRLGLESCGASKNSATFDDETRKTMEKYAIKCFSRLQLWYLKTKKFEDGHREVVDTNLLDAIASGKALFAASPTQRPQFANIFSEPGGLGTHGVPGIFFGEPWERTPAETNHYEYLKFQVKNYIRAIRKVDKDVKILLPWGDPGIPIPFLMDTDDRDLTEIAGMCYDGPPFGRLPEAQISQNTVLHRMFLFNETWRKYRPGKEPLVISVEGPHVAPLSSAYFDSEDRRAAHNARFCLILAAYGVSKQLSAVEIADCGDYWGEEQYGGAGLLGRLPELNPHVMCSTFATLVRHLRHMVFDGWDETGTRAIYSLRFRDARDNSLLRVLWTPVGKRAVRLAAPDGAEIDIYDPMDNMSSLVADGKGVPLTIGPMPVWVYGTTAETTVIAGAPDHSDSALGPCSLRLGAAKDLLRQSPGLFGGKTSDRDYTETFLSMCRRFPADFDVAATEEGLSVHPRLGPGAPDRAVMPIYTALHCNVPIPGVPEKISASVKGCCDWGRIVYELSDAKGERWISTGQKDYYNCDDQGARSYFCHDGWRLLRLGLPGNLPHDCYRTSSSCWWGAYDGDGIVDYPLTIRKVYVERRPKTIYVNSLEPVPNFAPIVIGDLYAEYGRAEDMGDSAVILSRLRQDIPAAELPDTIAELDAAGVLPPTEMLSVRHPDIQDIDGRKGIFAFREIDGATRYDIYVSTRKDGRGALLLKSVKKSGERVDGLRANTRTYVWVVYQTTDGGKSKPSRTFDFELKDLFSNK